MADRDRLMDLLSSLDDELVRLVKLHLDEVEYSALVIHLLHNIVVGLGMLRHERDKKASGRPT